MESLAYALALALMTLVPSLGPARAKQFGRYVATVSHETDVDPWSLVAIARLETNWNADNMGACCGGLMSIRWTAWSHWAEAHGLRNDHRTLEQLARDPERSLSLAAHALASLRTQCGRHPMAILGAYQSGSCGRNAYARRVTHIASELRARFGPVAARDARQRRVDLHFPPLIFRAGAWVAPLALTAATEAAGP